MGLIFSLARPVTSSIPPGNEDLFALTLKLALKVNPMDDSEVRKKKRNEYRSIIPGSDENLEKKIKNRIGGLVEVVFSYPPGSVDS
ncbi:MAG: hypothetical protein ACOCZL_03435 [Bacteroidota bacterium]